MRPHYYNTIQLSEVIATLEVIEVIVCFSWKRGSLSLDTHYIITKIVTSICGVTVTCFILANVL